MENPESIASYKEKPEASLAASHELHDQKQEAVVIYIEEEKEKKEEDDDDVVQIKDSINQLANHNNRKRPGYRPCVDYVPAKLLKAKNKQNYTPRVVSIGPFHYGNKKYAAMEKIKLRLLDVVIKERTKPRSFYIDVCRQFEPVVRDYYPDKVVGEELQSDDNFVNMMLADGVFIINFMMVRTWEANGVDYVKNGKAHIRLRTQHVIDIKHDLFMLENQLPFHFLQTLNGILSQYAKAESRKGSTTWKEDTIRLVANTWPHPERRFQSIYQLEPVHLLDLLRSFMLPAVGITSVPEMPSRSALDPRHLLDLLWSFILLLSALVKPPKPITSPRESPSRASRETLSRAAREMTTWTIKSAKKLQEAGVEIESAEWGSEYALFKRPGKLMILPLEIDDASQALFGNIIAFEQCYYPFHQYMSDYLILMEMLITDESEDLLEKKGVIIKKLTVDGATAEDVLCDLCKNIEYSSHPFSMKNLCIAVNKYCGRPAAFSRTTLRIGGIFLTLLTLTQTICSILAVTSGRSTK